MTRTSRGSKGPGYDYWGRRYGNKGGCNSPSSLGKKNPSNTKRVTNRAERRIAKQQLRQQC